MTIEVFAPAKVNLALHVCGRRADGYHLLDSLVVFANVGDRVSVRHDGVLSLTISGPESSGLDDMQDNLVLRAARSFGEKTGAAIRLEKLLPVASGMGGGSADAAASLVALARLWGCPLPGASDVLKIGADVPVCLAGQSTRMQGIGDVLTPVVALPRELALVLVNPRVATPTPAVFNALEKRDNAPMDDLPVASDQIADFTKWLAAQRNDLQSAAISLAPVISETLAAIETTECLIARMSGSGATCFGLFENLADAEIAAESIRRNHPDWWIAAASIRDG